MPEHQHAKPFDRTMRILNIVQIALIIIVLVMIADAMQTIDLIAKSNAQAGLKALGACHLTLF